MKTETFETFGNRTEPQVRAAVYYEPRRFPASVRIHHPNSFFIKRLQRISPSSSKVAPRKWGNVKMVLCILWIQYARVKFENCSTDTINTFQPGEADGVGNGHFACDSS
jgi:hypothetical protein